MSEYIDEMDQAILKRIGECPGECIREIIRPFLRFKSESALRSRVERLALRNCTKLKTTRHEVLCYPTDDFASSKLVEAGDS